MKTSSNPAARLAWPQVFTALDAVPPEAIPGTARCPLCQAPALSVYQDTRPAGGWFGCSACRQTGDALDLAARTWRTDRRQAINRLLPGLSPQELAGDEARPQARAQALWIAAQDRLFRAGEGLRLFQPSFTVRDTTKEDFARQAAPYLGVAARETLSGWLSTAAVAKLFPAEQRCQQPWKECAVLPFQDLPGRLSAFWLGRRKSGEVQTAYLAADGRRTVPAGVLGLEHFLTEQAPFLALLDPLLAVRLRLKCFSELEAPPPILGLYPPAPAVDFLQTHGPRLVFWGRRYDADLFRHARAANARIAAAWGDQANAEHQIRDYSPAIWVGARLREARPWPEVLERVLRRLPVAEAELLLQQLRLPPAELQDFLASVRKDLRNKLAALPSLQETPAADSNGVLATPAGWQRPKTQELVAGCSFRVDRILVEPDGSTAYEGSVTFQGEELPFRAAGELFPRKPLTFLRQFLLQAGKGFLTFQPAWESKALAAALSGTPPQVVRRRQPGWSVEPIGWILSGFIVYPGGEIVTSAAAGDPARLPPGPLSPEARCLLSQTEPSVELVWAVFLAVAHNVLAPAYRYAPRGILLTGPGTVAAQHIAGALGCRVCHTGRGDVFSRLRQDEARGGWPLLAPGEGKQRTAWLAWLEEEPHNALIPVGWWLARLLYASGAWLRLEVRIQPELPPELTTILPELLGSFLVWTARRRLARVDGSGTPLAQLLADVEAWFAEQAGQLRALRRGRRLLEQSDSSAAAREFLTVAGRLYDEGRVQLDWAAYEEAGAPRKKNRLGWRSGPAIVYDPDAKGLWLFPVAVNQALELLNLPGVEPARVRAALDASAWLLAEEERGGQLCWLIPEQAWTERWQFRGTQPLRLVERS